MLLPGRSDEIRDLSGDGVAVRLVRQGGDAAHEVASVGVPGLPVRSELYAGDAVRCDPRVLGCGRVGVEVAEDAVREPGERDRTGRRVVHDDRELDLAA